MVFSNQVGDNSGYGTIGQAGSLSPEGERITEAEASRRYLESKGVPSKVMYLDNQSHITWENVLDARQIMQRYGMRTAIIVSNDFHHERAQMYARELGMHTSSTDYHESYGTTPPKLRMCADKQHILIKDGNGIGRKENCYSS